MNVHDTELAEFAQRTVSRRQGWLRRTVTTKETTTVHDRETVRRWIREMHGDANHSVTVNRPWGSVLATSAGGPPAGVTVLEPTRLMYAGKPTGVPVPDGTPLTPAQVEQIVLDALTADRLPEGPVWHEV